MKRRALASLPALALVGPRVGEVTGADPHIPPGPTAVEAPGIVAGNLPAFHEALKAELTYPLAWGNAPIRNFRAWRRAALAKVEESLCQRPDHTPFRVEVVDERPADGYARRTLLFNVTRHSRVRATMLVPEGRGPFPGVLLLHDHGSKFDIGKEKLIRPWYDETAWRPRRPGRRGTSTAGSSATRWPSGGTRCSPSTRWAGATGPA